MIKKQTTTAPAKKSYQVLPGFCAHIGKSVHRAGSVVQLTEAQAVAHAHQIEAYPQPAEVLAARAAKQAPDATPGQFIVREGFVVWRGEEMHAAGSVLSLTPADAAQHAHAIEPLDNFVPPAPPAPEDLTTRPYVVRFGFSPTFKGELRKGGTLLHLTAREAHEMAHMIEPDTARAS